MSDQPQSSGERKTATPRSHFNNWISAIGGVLAVGSFFSFALLVWMDLTGDGTNPYLGIFTYLVAPGFLITGLLILFGGAWAQRRWGIKHTDVPDKWRLDFSSSRNRLRVGLFVTAGICFLLLSSFGSYQSYHVAESNMFCGQVCHSAMNPEYTTYQRSSHARVDCVECHIGSGAASFVKAKINGIHQLIAFTLTDYERPIATPLKNLPSAEAICEQCHWPEKFQGNVEINYDHFLSDKDNSAYSARMLMHVNTSQTGGPSGGIHWHASKDNKVEYYATDPQRQEIPWVRVTNLNDNTTKVFRAEDFQEEPPSSAIRTMDCLDCHNRPAHVFPTANDSVEKALVTGALSLKLPKIKRVAVKAMTQKEITTEAEALALIEAYLLDEYSEAKYAKELPGAIATIQNIYRASMFPERKADWRVYPNNIGHKNWLGCFRCHDNQHATDQGKMISSSDCNSCHTILAQGSGAELSILSAKGFEFKHPDGELDPDLTCIDCHTGGIPE